MATALSGIRAYVFDAYGTLFDYASAAAECRTSGAAHRLGIPADAISFQSPNAWDPYAALAFGMRAGVVQPLWPAPRTPAGKTGLGGT
jgi:hypothetical protein